METSNQQMYDAALRHQTYVLRYSAGVRNKINDLLDQTEDEISGKLIARLGKSQGLTKPGDWERLNQLQQVIFEIRGEAWKAAGSLLYDESLSMVAQESKFYAYLITSVSPVILDTVTPHPETLKAIVTERPFEGRILSDWVSKLTEDDISRINKTINSGIIQGRTAQEVTRDLFGTANAKGTDGITQMTRGSVNMMVRTAMQHITSSVRREVSLANSDIVEMEEWVATLDGRTCWTEDTLITMADGSKKRIADIKDQDLVLGGITGKECRVLGVFKSIEPSSVAMYNYNNEYIGSATNGHRILTRKGWKTAESICLSSEFSERQVLYRSNEKYQKKDARAYQQVKKPSGFGNKQGNIGFRNSATSDTGNSFNDEGRSFARNGINKKLRHSFSKWIECFCRWKRYFWITGAYKKRSCEKSQGHLFQKNQQGRAVFEIEEKQRCLDSRINEKDEGYQESTISEPRLFGENHSHKSQTKITRNVRETQIGNQGEMGRPSLQGKSECCARNEAGSTQSIGSVMGGEEKAENVCCDEREVERQIFCGENEGKIVKPRIEDETCREWTQRRSGVDRRWSPAEECCGQEDVDRGEEDYSLFDRSELLEEEKRGVFEGAARGEKRIGNVEIISLSIEGDSTYVAGGMIVHNTPFCKATDGQTFKPGEGPQPPAHPGCRSVRAMYLSQDIGVRPSKPVTERLLVKEYAAKNDLGSINNRDDLPHGTKGDYDEWARKRVRELVGQVPAKTTYNDWLKTQTQEFQIDTLGKTRADLFRKGGLTLDKFIDADGTTLTLKEVAQRDAAAFERAGLDVSKFLN